LDAHDHEPSYYEVALTNRQVVTGFVILLICLFASFLSGVWLGKSGGSTSPGPALAAMSKPAEAGEAKLEQLTFFGERGADARDGGAAHIRPAPPAAAPPAAARPERAAPTAAELEAERLRKTLEAEMALNRTAPAEAPASEVPPSSAAPGTRVRRRAEAEPSPSPAAASLPDPIDAAPATGSASASPPVPAAARASAATAAPAPTWIQVYSSTNGGNAQGLAARLRRGGFQVVVLEARSGGAVTYRVRVGPYPARAAADAAAARLRRDFRLDTWVTDQP